jgi:putative transposase
VIDKKDCGCAFTLEDAREKLRRWQQDYNLVRPHSALQDQAPAAFVVEWVATTTPTDQDTPELLETLT